MHRGRFIFAAVLALATTSAQAVTLVNTDFTLQDPTRSPTAWQTNGTAGLDISATGPGPQVSLALTHNMNNETGTAWTLLQARVPSFSMIADVFIDEPDAGSCPADGFTMAFAPVPPDFVGAGGSALGLYGNEELAPRFIALEVNTWYKNSVESTENCTSGDKHVTVGFTNTNAEVGVGRSEGQESGTPEAGGLGVGEKTVPVRIVGGGWYRYQWNVDTTTRKMAVYLTGLEDSNRATQNQLLTEVTFGADAPPIDFVGRWGLTAATGGANQNTRVAQVRIESPMIAPPAPTAGP